MYMCHVFAFNAKASSIDKKGNIITHPRTNWQLKVGPFRKPPFLAIVYAIRNGNGNGISPNRAHGAIIYSIWSLDLLAKIACWF